MANAIRKSTMSVSNSLQFTRRSHSRCLSIKEAQRSSPIRPDSESTTRSPTVPAMVTQERRSHLSHIHWVSHKSQNRWSSPTRTRTTLESIHHNSTPSLNRVLSANGCPFRWPENRWNRFSRSMTWYLYRAPLWNRDQFNQWVSWLSILSALVLALG